MNLVDSSGWLEYFKGSSQAENFAPAIEDTANLLVSVINMYEVFKKVYDQGGETAALRAVALMQQGKVQPVTMPLSINAARISGHYKLPMSDSIVYATAEKYQATLHTQNSDLKDLPNIRYFAL